FTVFVFILTLSFFFFFQAEDGIRDLIVTGVQTCALPIFPIRRRRWPWHRFRDIPRGPFPIQAASDSRGCQGRGCSWCRKSSASRSEERRVGKEWRFRWARDN